jgi:hypothetical protein
MRCAISEEPKEETWSLMLLDRKHLPGRITGISEEQILKVDDEL